MARKPKEPDAIKVELPPSKLLARKIALWGVVAGLGATAMGLGYGKLQRYVERSYATSTEPPRVVLKSVPVWMRPSLVDQITKVGRPGSPSSSFDKTVLADVRDQLLSDTAVAPYIEKIHSVRRVFGGAPGDTIEVDATFRAPIAIVHYGSEYLHVDSSGIRLVESFTADKVPSAVYGDNGKVLTRVIEGVKSPPPDPGMRWKGADLHAGLDLIKVLYDKPFAQEIVKVDVSNFGGRRDPIASNLTLGTRYNTEIRWGGPVNSKYAFGEIDDKRKLETLTQIVAEYGRVDARRPWIDIRFDKPNVPKSSPTAPGGDATTAADTR